MSKDSQRWAAAGLGFAAAVVWTTVGAEAALTCLLAAGLFVGATIAREGGLLGRIGGAAVETRRKLQAIVPPQAPPRSARPKAKQQQQQQPQRRPQPSPPQRKPQPAAAPPRPYDHDEPSGEHVYEVANYGW
jgi:hypothetical protein